jgi:hypothetical protein
MYEGKKGRFFTVLVFILTAGSVFAHDVGDLMVNIETQLGLGLPKLGIQYYGINVDDISDSTPVKLGLDLALRGTVHYYFVDFFSLNAGAGVSTFFNIYNCSSYQEVRENSKQIKRTDNLSFLFSSVYVTVPFGLRFSFNSFIFGAGITGNFPVFSSATSSSNWTEESTDGHNTEKLSGKDSQVTDKTFKLDPYLGWYFDIGFDKSGIKGRDNGFGMQIRFSGSFSDKIATNSDPAYIYKPYGLFNISIIFQSAFQAASLPIKKSVTVKTTASTPEVGQPVVSDSPKQEQEAVSSEQ